MKPVFWAALAGFPVLAAGASPVHRVVGCEISAGASGPKFSTSAEIDRQGLGTPLAPWAEVGGVRHSLKWSLVRTSRNSAGLTFLYRTLEPRLEAEVRWKAYGTGPVEETTTFRNLSGEAVSLPILPSLEWNFRAKPSVTESMYVEKAAGQASEQGVHVQPLGPVEVLCRPYVSDAVAYQRTSPGRDHVPFLAVRDRATSTGWYAGVEFSGRVSLTVRPLGNDLFRARLGLVEEPESSTTVLAAGAIYALPTVFVGKFRGGFDDGCNEMKRWVGAHLRPATSDPRSPLLTLNSWGEDMGINDPLATRMIDKASALGIELFHVDAGWFRAVGDWRPHLSKFPDGIRKISDYAHQRKMKFGLWVGWTQGGIQAEAEDPVHVMNVHSELHREWFAKDVSSDWKPSDFVGLNLCLAEPRAADWCLKLLRTVVREYGVDMLEHDQQMIVDDCVRTTHGHTSSLTDTAYRSALGYYRVYDSLRREFPSLMFEDCVNGGRMVDYGAAKRASYFSIVDSYDPLSNRQAIFDVASVMPPSMCEGYVKAMPTKTLGEFVNMIRSGLLGWCSVMQDPNKWSEEQQRAAKLEFDFYKQNLRPLILNGDLFHISQRPSENGWDGTLYLNQAKTVGEALLFRGEKDVAPTHVFKLTGLDGRKSYRVHFADAGGDLVMTGRDFMSRGITVRLEPGTSERVSLRAR